MVCSHKQITTVSFDGDATLWDFDKVMRHSLSITLEELRNCIPGKATLDLTVEKMIEIRNTVAAELKGKTVNLEEIRLQAFKRTVEAVGGHDNGLAADLNALYLKHRFEDIELYPDVISTLDTLGQQFSLGLVSNGNSYPERCGLEDRFSFTVFAQDVGSEKPDQRIFQTACSKAGCSPEEFMHVGDSLESDVAGANALGGVSVWLNRTGDENTSAIQPDYEIKSLVELIDVAKHLRGKTERGFAQLR